MQIKLNKLNLKYIVFITFVIIVLIIGSAYFEISSSKKEIFKLLDEEAISLIKAINSSAENAVISTDEIESLINNNLLSIGELIREFSFDKLINSKAINTFLQNSNIKQIILVNKKGGIIYSKSILSSELRKNISDLILSYNESDDNEFIPGIINDISCNCYFVVLKRGSEYIFVGLDPKYFLDFRKKIGIGSLFKNLADQEEIKYIVLQDYDGIIAASKNIKELNSINSDEFLEKIVNNDTIVTRVYNHNGEDIYEAVQPLIISNDFYGIIRIGLSMQSIIDANYRMVRRILITSLVVIGIGVILFSLILANQHKNTLQYELKKLQSYNEKILENMADGVLALNSKHEVFFINNSAINILEIRDKSVAGKALKDILPSKDLINDILNNEEFYFKEFVLNFENRKIVRVSKSYIRNFEKESDRLTVVLLQDVTEEKNLELQVRRNEKLVAMGELAAGVAHEVRNPLNSISIIIQRLLYEFEPVSEKDKFHKLISTIREEIARINKIIEQFLKFARRPKLNLRIENISDIVLKSIEVITPEAKNIKIIKNIESNLYLKVDSDQILQALINVLKNSIQAVEKDGIVEVDLSGVEDGVYIKIKDNGKGIEKENLSKIFNLYYTTKPDGTGIGLSIVNQIISEHNGKIDIESEPKKGTTVNIFLPKN
ncbi:MAG TPA: ATP-binding protein [Bacteroidota bacterium]|nr:ATP-binding protein [Bacteroidota bacterium]